MIRRFRIEDICNKDITKFDMSKAPEYIKILKNNFEKCYGKIENLNMVRWLIRRIADYKSIEESFEKEIKNGKTYNIVEAFTNKTYGTISKKDNMFTIFYDGNLHVKGQIILADIIPMNNFSYLGLKEVK